MKVSIGLSFELGLERQKKKVPFIKCYIWWAKIDEEKKVNKERQ